MYKHIFDDFNNVKAPGFAVEKTIEKAMMISDGNNSFVIKKHRGLVTAVLAACLAVVFAVTLLAGFSKKAMPEQMNKSRFTISANAKQVELLGDAVSKSTIGAYSEQLTGGWAMYPNLEKYKDSSPNFFQSFALNMFEIEGEGIASVTFKATSPGVYFAISPAGYFANADEEIQNKFTDLSIENSQYTAEELKMYGDGLSYGKTYCDTVTYLNLDANGESAHKIDLNNKFEIVLESNHNDAKMSEKLDRLWDCEQELLELRKHHTFEGGELSAEEEKLWAEADELAQSIRGYILDGSTIEVIVTFKDATTEKKVLKTDLVKTEDQRMWLTISE